jgi:hypothetical protein
MSTNTAPARPPNPAKPPAFSHRVCYVNHGEHLLNAWNANLIYPNARDQWTLDDWRRFLRMLKAFGYTCFEYWLMPTMFDLPSLKGGGIYERYANTMRAVADLAHGEGLEIECLLMLNVWGPRWFYACPGIPEERANLRKLWRHWLRELAGLDRVGLFPGDLGGCNLNGCTHETAIELDLEIAEIVKQESPNTRLEICTWGTPFCGWGSDAVEVPGWNRSAVDLLTSGFGEHTHRDFHGTPERARAAFDYLAKRLPEFPRDTSVAINRDLIQPGDGIPYAREFAKLGPIVTWDYYVSEHEGTVCPHWRLDAMADARRADRAAAPYLGGICYTMSPKLNLLTLYGGAQTFIDPQADPNEIAAGFYAAVFGPEHAELGELTKAFSGRFARNESHAAFGLRAAHLPRPRDASPGFAMVRPPMPRNVRFESRSRADRLAVLGQGLRDLSAGAPGDPGGREGLPDFCQQFSSLRGNTCLSSNSRTGRSSPRWRRSIPCSSASISGPRPPR